MKTEVYLFLMITNYQVVRSRSLTHRSSYKFMPVRLLTMKINILTIIIHIYFIVVLSELIIFQF